MKQPNYRHPKWQKRSKEIMDRDGWACLGCGDRSTLLQAHHIVYIPDREVWDYPDNLLQTLCEPCHNLRHELLRKACDALKIACSRVPTRRLAAVAQRIMNEAMKEIEP